MLESQMKNILLALVVPTILFASVASFAQAQVQWCAVINSSGQVVSGFCFNSLNTCNQMKASGQSCVAMPKQ
jgi:hypothetical protein